MNPELLRLTTGFLVALVLLSYAPALPGLLQKLRLPAGSEQLSDALLGTAAVLALGLLFLVVRRRRANLRPIGAPTRVASTPAGSVLRSELRLAVEQGERIAAIARRYEMAQDAVRVAVSSLLSTPAARPERVASPRGP